MQHRSYTLAFIALALALLSLHIFQFRGREYRQDEAWRVHTAIERDLQETMQWALSGTHPPLWQMSLEGWLTLAGDDNHAEPLMRFQSVLFTLLTFAITFRLGADLFDWQVGLMAMFLLGTAAFFLYHTHELRPYPSLVTYSIGAQWALLRWIRQPNFWRALLFVGFGIGAIYTHVYGILFLAALALTALILVRWDAGLYVRAFGLYVAVGLAFLGWIVPFLHSFLVVKPGGIIYALPTNFEAFEAIYRDMQSNPRYLDLFLIIVGIVAPVAWVLPGAQNQAFRFGRQWRKLYVALQTALMLLLAYTTHLLVDNLTVRNLLAILPPLMILAAYGLRVFPVRMRLILLVVVASLAITTFRSFYLIIPMHDVVAYFEPRYEPGQPILYDDERVGQQIVVLYYLQEVMTPPIDERLTFNIMSDRRGGNQITNMPDVPANRVIDNEPEDIARFQHFLDAHADSPTLWRIRGEHMRDYDDAVYIDMLEQHYELIEAQSFGRSYRRLEIMEYRRVR